MILLVFALLGLLLGLLTGGSLSKVSHYSLYGALLPIAAFLLKAGAARFLVPQTGAVIVCLIQYSLLFLFILLNHRRPVWPLFAFTGTLLNFLVIVFNGGCMPVAAALASGAGERLTQLAEGRVYAYCLADASTRLPFLGDVIRIGPAGMPLGFASVGDIMLSLGVAILCWQMTKAVSGAEKNESKART
ncbi:MAG: DUF5317 domain-containing protein [Eubacteriales bacterium]|jgi:hypothetical protein|nr:DUF5317 domain-containing protein [Eubacteriales bacterium]